MSKQRVRLVPNKQGIAALCKSTQMQAGLSLLGEDTARRVNYAAARLAKTPPRIPPYHCRVKVLDHTAVAVVRPSTKQGKAIEAKYDLLELFGSPRE